VRRLLIALTVLTVATFGLVAASSAPANCTKTGTSSRNVLAGTRNRDVICAGGGNDYVAGLSGADTLKGGAGNDTMVGGPGQDRLFGAGGRDKLFTVDDAPGDSISGGAGRDKCFTDPGDTVTGCERTFRAASIATAKALSAAFGGEASLAEDLLAEVPTVTVIVSGPTGPPGPPGTGFPPCTPPPNIPPEPLC
jgi:Ca2+-binding RTX toxin-like protein